AQLMAEHGEKPVLRAVRCLGFCSGFTFAQQISLLFFGPFMRGDIMKDGHRATNGAFEQFLGTSSFSFNPSIRRKEGLESNTAPSRSTTSSPSPILVTIRFKSLVCSISASLAARRTAGPGIFTAAGIRRMRRIAVGTEARAVIAFTIPETQ